jgi:O-antigen/teichoic acid export membrane protein
LGTLLFADVVVTLLYGRGHFDPAAVVLRFFAPLLPLLFMDTLFGTALIAAGKTNEIAIVKAVSVVASTAFAIVLIPICQTRWGNGGIGLVLAFGSVEMMMLIAFLLLLPRGVLDRNNLLDVFRTLIAGGGAILVLWALPAIPSLMALLVCVGVFILVAFATGLLLKTDLDTVSGLIRTKKI